MTDAALAPYRLPGSAKPVRYDLEFVPDLVAATFSGSARVEILLTEPVSEIVINAVQLNIAEASISPGWVSADEVGESARAQIVMEPEEERVHFVSQAVLEPGRYTVSSRFSAVLNDLLLGFYRSRYVDADGKQRYIATTHFEETDARMAFPCFDEPDLKAVFGITLVVPQEMFAVSNARELSSEDLGDGTRRVRFADTIKMSTYIVAFVVGPFVATDPVDVLGTPVRVIHLPGQENLTQMALDFADHALRFYTDYFDIPYPGDKLDLVGIPDFAQGAMENLGCVTFREADLLADFEHASLAETARIAEVTEHEIAHMWFGDLVTMKWWNGVWLNEAFATFMAFLCHDDKYPEQEPFLFAASRYWPVAFEDDATSSTRPIEFPVARPEEATAMFDSLTYYKGGGVLWMIERYLGRERFRDGIRRYLKAHAYGNAETTDLWDALEEANPDVRVRALMDSWIFQGGYPLVTASWHDGTVELTQQPFSLLSADELATRHSAIGTEWLIPVMACAPSSPNTTTRVLLTKAPEVFAAPELPVVVNCGGSGFYRVRYDETLRLALLNNLELLRPLERYYLASDVWATTRAGLTNVAQLFRTFASLEDEENPFVWTIAVSALRTIDLVVPDDLRDPYAAYLRRMLRPKLDRIGWRPQPGEIAQTSYIRGVLIGTLGTIGHDQEVVSDCYARFQADRTPGREIDADSASGVLAVVAAHASRALYETILDRYRHPISPLDEMRYEFSLYSVTDLGLAREIFELARTELRNQNAPFILGGMMRRRELAGETWRYVTEHFDELDAKFPPSLIVRMFEGIPSLVAVDADGRSRYLEEVRAFVDAKIGSARRRSLEQEIEELEVNLRFAKAIRSELGALLADQQPAEMNLGAIAATVAVVTPAELPDKTFIAAVTLASRHRPVPVFFGVFLGLVAEAAVAVVAGRLLAFAPHRDVDAVTAFGFLAGAVYLAFVRQPSAERAAASLASKEDTAITRVEAKTERLPASWKLVAMTFLIVFVAEMGDLTQIVIANLSARHRDALSVFVGAVIAFALTSAFGVTVGQTITRFLPLGVVRKVSAGILVGLGVWSALSAAGV